MCWQDFQELVVIRAQLAGKFGKEFASESSSDLTCRKWHVNENLIRYASSYLTGLISSRLAFDQELACKDILVLPTGGHACMQSHFYAGMAIFNYLPTVILLPC